MSHAHVRTGYLVVALTAAAALVGAATVSAQGTTTTKAGTIAAAKAAVSAHPNRFGFGPGQQLKTLAVYDSPQGATIRFERSYRGLPMFGGQLIIHLTPSGAYRYANGQRVAAMPASISPAVAASTATASVTAKIGYPVATRSASLAVYATPHSARLAWQVNTADASGLRGDVSYVSATSGRQLATWPTVDNDNGIGKTLYSGRVKLKDVKQGKKDYILQDKLPRQPADLRCPQQLFGRQRDDLRGSQQQVGQLHVVRPRVGWSGCGVRPLQHLGLLPEFSLRPARHRPTTAARQRNSFVHYCSNYTTNANWSDSCFCMIFGDRQRCASGWGPLVTIDVGGHEMTHGVIETADVPELIYSGESGGLNESTSDVMGTQVEWYANSAKDVPDYMIGEEFFLNFDPETHYLRRMDHPSLDGPSKDCWYSGVGGVDVHYSSGVGNHLFYLLSEGSGAKTINGLAYDSPTCNASTVVGIGHDKAAAIWYKALTEQWVPTTSYHDARVGMLQAATDLYGAGSTEYNAVDTAWAAVGVTP